MGYLVDSSSGHLGWFESVARKSAPVAGPRCEDDEGRWPASSVSWPGPLGLLARSAIEIGDLHTASRHGLEPQDLRAYWSELNSPISTNLRVVKGSVLREIEDLNVGAKSFEGRRVLCPAR